MEGETQSKLEQLSIAFHDAPCHPRMQPEEAVITAKTVHKEPANQLEHGLRVTLAGSTSKSQYRQRWQSGPITRCIPMSHKNTPAPSVSQCC